MSLYTFGDQFANESALWYPNNGEFVTFKKIAVQNLNESRNTYGRIAEGLQDSNNTIALRTRYQYAYKPPKDDEVQHIKYRDLWYEITEVRPRELGALGLYRSKEYVLILTEVEYGPNYKCAD